MEPKGTNSALSETWAPLTLRDVWELVGKAFGPHSMDEHAATAWLHRAGPAGDIHTTRLLRDGTPRLLTGG